MTRIESGSTFATTKSKIDSKLGCIKAGPCTLKAVKQKDTGKLGTKLRGDATSLSDPSLTPLILSGTGPLKTGSDIPVFRHKETPVSGKLKLGLYPIDKLTCERLEKDGHNPYLELTLGPNKKISSVVNHLKSKWETLSAAGELMLFPYDARVENLCSYKRWTSKDSNTRAADVYDSMGCPSVFQLRYGCFSILETKACPPALPVLHSDDLRQNSENQKIDIEDERKHPWAVTGQQRGKIRADDSRSKDTPIIFEGTLQAADIERNATRDILLGTDGLSNLSRGSLFSDVSATPDVNQCHPQPQQYCSIYQQFPSTSDTFDAAIAGYITRYQPQNFPSYELNSSIWDAEETRQPFPTQKMTSLMREIPGVEVKTPLLFEQSSLTNSCSLFDMLNVQRKPDEVQKMSTCNLQLHTQGDASLLGADVHSHMQKNGCKRTIADMQCHAEGSQNDCSSFDNGDFYEPVKLIKFL